MPDYSMGSHQDRPSGELTERVPTEPFHSAEVLEAIGKAAEEPDIDRAIELEFEATRHLRRPDQAPPAPGPTCPKCLGLDTRSPEGKLAWIRCSSCGHEWRGTWQELRDVDAAEQAEARRGRVKMAHEESTDD